MPLLTLDSGGIFGAGCGAEGAAVLSQKSPTKVLLNYSCRGHHFSWQHTLKATHRPPPSTEPYIQSRLTGIEGAAAVACHVRGRGRGRQLRLAESQDRGDSGGWGGAPSGRHLTVGDGMVLHTGVP